MRGRRELWGLWTTGRKQTSPGPGSLRPGLARIVKRAPWRDDVDLVSGQRHAQVADRDTTGGPLVPEPPLDIPTDTAEQADGFPLGQAGGALGSFSSST